MEHTWYWHSSIARTAPSLTESMKPGLRLQNFTCNSLYKTKFSNSTIIKVAALEPRWQNHESSISKTGPQANGILFQQLTLSTSGNKFTEMDQYQPIKGMFIYYVISDGGGGSSWFITLLHRGGGCVGVRPIYYNIT